MTNKKTKFYAYFLPTTQERGIVNTWVICKKKTDGIHGAKFKKFQTEDAAQTWLSVRVKEEENRMALKGKEKSKLPKDKSADDVLKREAEEIVRILPPKAPNKEIRDFDFKIYFDGACEPKNPGGTASYGWLIERDGQIIEEDAQIIGDGKDMTNNVGEYTGLLKALERLNSLDLQGSVKIFGDSKLVCNMVSTEWGWNKKKTQWIPHGETPHLAILLEKVFKQLENYEYDIQWIPREQNQAADDLSKKPLIEAGIFKPESEMKKCQKCGAKLIFRNGEFGPFYGCSRYPKCNYIEKG